MLVRANLQISFYLEAKFFEEPKKQTLKLAKSLQRKMERRRFWEFRYLIYLMFSSSVFSQISWNLNTSDKEYISIDKIPFISIEGYNGVWFSRIPAPFQLCSKGKIRKDEYREKEEKLYDSLWIHDVDSQTWVSTFYHDPTSNFF